jgi:predicted RNA polymerase sigma factor
VNEPFEDLLRDLAPQVPGALVRRHGQFDACEDAVQQALLDATVQWPRAARMTASRPEQLYLTRRAAELRSR